MGEFIEAAKIDELKNGAMKATSAAGHEILLARVKGKYYATDNRCPHMGGMLSQGKITGTVVTCPRHYSRFDLRDGHVVRWMKGSGLVAMIGKVLKSPRPLTVYHVRVEGDKVWVEMP